MCSEHDSFNRRDLLRGLGRAAAVAALAPTVLSTRVAEAHAPACRELTDGSPESVGMSSKRIADVLARVQRRADDGLFPGAVALIARRGRIVAHRAFGTRVCGKHEPVTRDTLFDLLSITKVVATATSALILVQDGVLGLNDPVGDYLPEFAEDDKAHITVRDMLRYTAGLPLDVSLQHDPDGEGAWRRMAEEPLEYEPGTQVLYSDLTYRLLGRVVEAAAGTDLDAFAKARIWRPLGMRDTTFNPSPALRARTAATGYSKVRGRLVRGEVQDEQDYALGGVVGCDGVFSTARDLATFCQMILNGGQHGRARILRRHLVDAMVSNQTPEVSAGTPTCPRCRTSCRRPRGMAGSSRPRASPTAGCASGRGPSGRPAARGRSCGSIAAASCSGSCSRTTGCRPRSTSPGGTG
jgi:CubicO group peptidase (beta-lactamase class C family)